MSEIKNPLGKESEAEFLGWQKNSVGEPIALFNVTAAEHPLFGSTVSENTLRKQNLKIPEATLPEEQGTRPENEQ